MDGITGGRGHIMRQEDTTTRKGKDPQDDCTAAIYAVWDGDSSDD